MVFTKERGRRGAGASGVAGPGETSRSLGRERAFDQRPRRVVVTLVFEGMLGDG